MDIAAGHQLPVAQREKTVSRRKNKAPKMHANAAHMSTYVPIIALTAAAVGWVLMFWEKHKNAGLRRKLEELEATYTSRLDDVPAATTEDDDHHPEDEPTTDEVSLQLDALRQEIEAEEHDLLLDAEDIHLQTLKEELEELRKGMQEDLKAVAASSITSGRSTPNQLLTPARSCNGAEDRDDTDSMYSQSLSPLLQTPSPPQYNYINSHESKGEIHPQQRRLRAHALSPSTSGTTTPLTPHSPLSTTQFAGDDDAWLAFSPAPSTSSMYSTENGVKPSAEVAVAPPVPALTLPVPFSGLDAALTAAFEHGSLDLEDWENEEEWLMKTQRNNNTSNTEQKEKENNNSARDIEATSEPLIVRPLPKVTVPRLKLTETTPGKTHSGGPLTLSARGGIKTFENSQNTARRQRQLTSRLSHSSSPIASGNGGVVGTPRTARTATNSSPSGSLTARRTKAVAVSSSSPSSSVSVGNSSSGGKNGSSPSLFTKGMSAGAAARRDAPTPRLVFGAKVATDSNSPGSKADIKTFPLERSPSSTSVNSTSTTDESMDMRPRTRIPRLQLPLVQ